MNRELIHRLYRQSVTEAVNNHPNVSPCPAWSWEEAFARAIVLECSRVAKLEMKDNRVCDAIENHFGVSE